MKDHEKGRLSCIIHVGARCHQKGAYKIEVGESETGKRQRHTKRDKNDRDRQREKEGEKGRRGKQIKGEGRKARK